MEGVRGLQSGGGSSRRDAVGKALEGAGGSLESFYFAFGAVQTKMTVLLTPEEVDEAAKKSVRYTPPGG